MDGRLGREHESVVGNPVAFHLDARTGRACSNGFQTIRALGVLMTLLGTIDRPGGFRHKAPFPRPIPPFQTAERAGGECAAEHPAGRYAVGWLADPNDLFVDDQNPVRNRPGVLGIPLLSVHGLDAQRHHQCLARRSVSRSTPCSCSWPTWHGTPSMNTVEVRKMLVDKDEKGDYKIPFIIVCDAFQSEMTRCRPGAAGHHLPPNAMRDVDARPADLGVRRPGRFGVHRGPADRECKPFQES